MSLTCRIELAVTIAVVICTCVCGMKIDFTRLSHHRRTYIPQKRGSECTGNPCPVDKPFLCKTSFTCIALKYVCDNTYDCEDGFDEEQALCTAASRPSIDHLLKFLTDEQDWIIPKLFGGAEPAFVAHGLAVASDIDDLSMILALPMENIKNLHRAFQAAMEGDERPLLAMKMPERSWHEVQYMLQQLLDSGFKI